MAKSTPYPPFPANDKLQPDLGILLWPELRRVTQPPHITGPLAASNHLICKYYMRKFITLALLMTTTLINAQNFVEYFKKVSSVAGLGEVERIHLDTNYKFEYIFAFDLFYDRISGTYEIKKDTIIFSYPAKEIQRMPLIDTTRYVYKGNPSFTIIHIDTSYINIPNPVLNQRPNKLLFRRNKLIYLNQINNKNRFLERKPFLKRVDAMEWNDSGATFMRLESN